MRVLTPPRTRTPHGAPSAPPDAPEVPPAPPDDLADISVDEGPMRREFLRQIAFLERELAARVSGWVAERTSARRGPGLLPTAILERIRDELSRAVKQRRAR